MFPLWKPDARILHSDGKWPHLQSLPPGGRLDAGFRGCTFSINFVLLSNFMISGNPKEMQRVPEANQWELLFRGWGSTDMWKMPPGVKLDPKFERLKAKWENVCLQETRLKCCVCQEPIESEYTQLDDGQPICLKDYEVIDWFKTHAHEMFADAEAEVLWMWESNCWSVHKKRQRPRCLYQLLWKNGELICSVVRGVCRPIPCRCYYIFWKSGQKTFT